MKRLLLLLACLLALCTTVVAAEPAISDMKTDCTLTGSGACQVTLSSRSSYATLHPWGK